MKSCFNGGLYRGSRVGVDVALVSPAIFASGDFLEGSGQSLVSKS